MKLPLSWIKEFIELNLPAPQIAKMLTQAGLEVDSFAYTPLNFERVIIGRVLKVEKHPNAEKLVVAKVSDGNNEFQVVCGAPNCREGLKTAFAIEGAVLYDDDRKPFVIKKAKLRGVESFGMLCSEGELGLGENKDGIMEFADHLKEGTDLVEIYGDIVFEISLTPNLGHCASVLGVARELSAISNLPFKEPKAFVREALQKPIENFARVTVLDEIKCPRYACRVIQNVQIGPSPDWLQKRLIACDMRPINNIVDITNLIMMELGQPLHAFDYDLLEGHQIIVRTAADKEEFVTLDGKKRILSTEDLMICDQKKPIALAGVMGGMNSEINSQTKNVLLEAACFQPSTIRRTSKNHALQTESSKRFERGSDPNQVINALERAAMLMEELAGGIVCLGLIDEKQEEFSQKSIHCRLTRANQMLGTQLSLGEVESVFQRLGMEYKWDGQDTLTVNVPTYRNDVQSEIDLIEEIGRIYGYENIPKRPPMFTSSVLPHAPIYLFEKKVRSCLIAEGLQEFLTCDLIGPALLSIAQDPLKSEASRVSVLNPTSVEQSILRTSLLPGLLQTVKFNYDRENHDISAFEIGRIHYKIEEHYKEETVAAVILTGSSRPQHWGVKPLDVDFYDLKGIIENFFHALGIENFNFQSSQLEIFHPGRQAGIIVEGLKVGTIGEVHPSIVRKLDVPKRIFFAEIDLHDLYRFRKHEFMMKEVPIYPGSTRDLTLTLNDKVPVQNILNAIRTIPSPLLEEVSVIDFFKSEKIGKENKNITFHFVYRDKSQTISQEVVDTEHARIIAQIDPTRGG